MTYSYFDSVIIRLFNVRFIVSCLIHCLIHGLIIISCLVYCLIYGLKDYLVFNHCLVINILIVNKNLYFDKTNSVCSYVTKSVLM